MQPHDGTRKGLVGMFTHVVKSDGIPGLYRGVRACEAIQTSQARIQLTKSIL